MIVTIGGQKGGDGKSTTCLNLAVMLLALGFDPIIVDTDYQGSCCLFGQNRDMRNIEPRLTVIQKVEQKVSLELKSLDKKYSHVLVDAGGYDSIGFRTALIVSDVLITPVQPADFSIDTLPLINSVVSDAKIPNEKLKAFLFFNLADPNPSLKKTELDPQYQKVKALALKEEKETEKKLERNKSKKETGFEYILCKNILYKRVIYRHSIIEGKGVIELNDKKAINEFTQLYEEMFND